MCSSAPTESSSGLNLSQDRIQQVLRQYKDMILKETTPSDTIIFVGGSASYFYYLFNDADDRHCRLVPISASRYNNKNLLINDIINLAEILLGNPAALRTRSTTTLEERTKGFCESFIDPLQLDKSPALPETSKRNPQEKLLNNVKKNLNLSSGRRPKGRIVLVDYSVTGDSVNGFLRVIKSCVAKTYNPYFVDENVNLLQPVVFLNILGDTHLYWKSTVWNPGNNFGLTEKIDLVVPGAEAANVVHKLGLAEQYNVPRLLPSYPDVNWKLNKVEAEKFVNEFQQDPKVQEQISKLQEIGRVNYNYNKVDQK